MASALRVTLELGPKSKKVVALAPDWPGLERGAKTEAAAVERLRAYLPRYAPVAQLAGMGAAFAADAASGATEIVERYPGVGSTDFWGISFAFSSLDQRELSRAELERELALMRASWAFFDGVRGRVSTEMRKGPRGGGRDRDRIVWHTVAAEQDMAAKVGARVPLDGLLDGGALGAYRDAYCAAIRTYHAQSRMARSWPLRYLTRHTAFHTLDHTWEMQDKDLAGEGA